MPRLTLERAGKVLDLDALLTGPEGAQAVAGITGFGLPPVTVQWTEGAGNGSTYRGRRVNARPIDLPITYKAASRAGLKSLVRDLAFVLDGEATLRVTEDDGTSQTLAVRRTGGGDYVYGTDTDGKGFLKTVVTLQAGDPFWASSVTRSALYTGAQVPTSVLITNPGTAPAFPTWTVYGPTLGFTITSPSGEVLKFSEYVPQGASITIDTKRGTVVDQAGTNRYSGLAAAPRFFTLPPGDSTVLATIDRSSAAFQALQAAGRKNYVTNPVFTVDTTGWTLGQGVTRNAAGFLQGAAQSYSPSQTAPVQQTAMKTTISITGLTPGNTYQVLADVTNTLDPAMTTPPPHPYNATSDFYLYNGAVTNDVTVSIIDPANATATVGKGTVAPGSGTANFTFVAPSSTVTLQFVPANASWRAQISPSMQWAKTSAFTVDNVFVGEPGSFFSGATPSTAQTTYSWTGTAHNSISKEIPPVNTAAAGYGYSFNPRDWMVI